METMKNNRLHIGNLADDTTADTVTEAFRQDGREVVSVQLVMSRDAGRSRGFGFVEMATDEAATAALTAVHGSTIDGRVVRVTVANAPKSRFGGSVGGMRPHARS